MIVSIAAGSLTDVIMRAAANELSPPARPADRDREPRRRRRHSGRPGLRGERRATATRICVVFHNQLSFNPVMFTNLPYDVDKELWCSITRLFFLIKSLAVHPSINVNSVAELRNARAVEAHETQLGHARPGLGA